MYEGFYLLLPIPDLCLCLFRVHSELCQKSRQRQSLLGDFVKYARQISTRVASGSHDGEFEDSLIGYCTVQSRRSRCLGSPQLRPSLGRLGTHRPKAGGSCTSESSIYFYKTTSHNVREGCHLQHLCILIFIQVILRVKFILKLIEKAGNCFFLISITYTLLLSDKPFVYLSPFFLSIVFLSHQFKLRTAVKTLCVLRKATVVHVTLLGVYAPQ